MKPNKTTDYLWAFYSNFGREFTMVFENLKNVSLFISDYNYKNYDNYKDWESFIKDDIIFCYIPECAALEKAILFMQIHSNYITDYEVSKGHMVVFKLNEPHKTALRQFKQSKFSKMYHDVEINTFFDMSAKFYAKYIDDLDKPRLITDKNCIHLKDIEKIHASLRLSYYHVLKRSTNLRSILECLYNSSIPLENELMDRINFKSEIYNYKNCKLTEKQLKYDGERN